MFRQPTINYLKNTNRLISTQSVGQTRAIAYVSSRNTDEARRNVVRLYRRWLQLIPWMKDVYHVPVTPALMQKRLRREFSVNNHVNDLHLIDALVYRGYQDYEEVEMHHKQRGHILRFFAEEEPAMMNPSLNKTSSLGQASAEEILPEHIAEYLKDNPEALQQIQKLMK